MDRVKSGARTTEFWLVLILVSTAAVACLIEVWRDRLDASGAIGLVSAAVATATYVHSRSAVKRAPGGRS